MVKYKITVREHSWETEANSPEEALRTVEEINWNMVDIGEIGVREKVEIYFYNLDEDTQRELRELYNIKHEKELNWDTVPITTIEKPEKD